MTPARAALAAALAGAALLMAGTAAAEGRLLGLVVGASDYGPGGLPLAPLTGPGNDARLMAGLLLERGADPDDVILLTEASGEGPTPDGPPTAAAILAGFDSLAERAGPGDQVVVLLAGHGWRQREAVRGSEPDGLDEVFLPVDYGPAPVGFDPTRHDPAPGALRDDEIGARVDALRARGADVFLVADFCHSGDSARGAPDPDRPRPRESRLDPPAAGRGAYVAFFAAPSGDRAMQGMAPIWAEPAQRRPHGLLTAYTVAALRDPSVTTWAEAAARVQAGLIEHDVRDASVRLDGPAEFEGDLDRPLPGAVAGDRVWTVAKPPSEAVDGRVRLERLELRAGALHGLEPGALVAVSEVREGRERPLLVGRATEVGAATAVLVPAAHGGVGEAAWRDLRTAEGRAYTDRRLWLARPLGRGPAPPFRVAAPAEAAAGLELAAAAGLGVRAAAPGEVAELHLRLAPDGRLVLAEGADGAPASAMGALPPGAGAEAVAAAVLRAARARRLRLLLGRLAAAPGEGAGLETSFHLWRPAPAATPGACPPFDPRHADLAGAPPDDAVDLAELGVAAGQPVTLRPCDVVFVRAVNRGAASVDASALALAPDGAVWTLPWSGDRGAVRFEPGRARIAAYQLDPHGSGALWEEVTVVAVPADPGGGAPLSLAGLRQPGVAAPPGEGWRSGPADAPLAMLELAALAREGLRSGVAATGAPAAVRRLMIRVAD